MSRNSEDVNDIINLVRQDDWRYDPWGSVMTALFQVAEYVYATHGIALPDFRPSPFLKAGEGCAQLANREFDLGALDTLVRADTINGLTELHRAYEILSRYESMLRTAGRSY